MRPMAPWPPPAATPVPVATAWPPEVSHRTRWIDLNQVVMPRVCCSCGEPGAFDELKVGGSDTMGKTSVTVGVPLCSRCAGILQACGVKDGKAPGGLLAAMRVPAELKPQYHHVVRSVSLSLKRKLFGVEVRFVFRNAAFAEAFEAANPKPTRR